MVGRFVKQQDVRRRRRSAGECSTSASPPTNCRCGVRVDFQLLEQIGRAIRVGPSIKAVFDIGAYCRKGGKVQFLNIARCYPVAGKPLSSGLTCPAAILSGRFARSVPPDQT